MRQYICSTCNREFGKISHLKDHLKKKFPCKPKLIINEKTELVQNKPNIVQTTLIDKPNIQTTFIDKTNIQTILIDKPNIQTTLIDKPNISESTTVDKVFACIYCDKKFNRKDNQTRHINNHCKVKKNLDEEKEKIFKLLLEKDNIINKKDTELDKKNKENEELKKLIKEQNAKINNQNKKINKILENIEIKNIKNINNGTINNNINNIIITPDKLLKFGLEDLSKIDNKLFNNVLKTTGKDCFIECAKNIYNNPMVPQNQNIYLSDISRNKFLAYDGKNWKLENKIKVLTDITDKIREYIDMNEDELKEKFQNKKFKENFSNKLKKYYDLYYEEDEIATKERIKQFQNLVDTNLINFLYDIRNDVKMNYNKLLEASQQDSKINTLITPLDI
jgi:DNA-directed RNA polymerase subunit RPC12/RpoP